ncbi:hypothetical protein EAF00_000830 [Botryotinia globosa]|nr:hypothetical protein EAF00_000830 [Botryotinia globosa]
MQTYSQGQLEKAQKFIDELRRGNGGIIKEDRQFLKREKPDILRSFDNIRRKLGASTQISIKTPLDLSTSSIQNAEDNKYTTSTDIPCLSFNLQEDRIVIGSNEDGFTQRDIKAICSIGESTKASIQGYIGEKGIGFKSVFNVSHKVHIQSGPYSSAFEYRKGDSVDRGLGMVTPMNEIPHQLPDDVRIRMILYLHEDEDRAALCQDLQDLPDTLLLFLKKLRRLTVRIEIPDRLIQKIRLSLMRSNNNDLSENIVRIKTAITGTITSVISRSFWVKKRNVVNLPAHSAREQIHEAEVVLAFLIDEDHVPVIKEQYAFAFLPLKKAGYKVTQATSSPVFNVKANRKLLEEVVEAFCSAINGPSGSLQHETLRYSWVRYIPTTAIADEFWGLLQPCLFAKLCASKFFFSLDGSHWTPNQLRLLPNNFRDENRDPLLRDLRTGPNTYVSESYDNSDISILKEMKYILFPTSGGVAIPKGLPLNLVDEKVLENPSREKLFSQLGVSECSPKRIFPLIQQRSFPTVRKLLASDLQDIRFLFWHHGELASDYPINMWLWNGQKHSVASPQKDGWDYLPQCENTYALANLFGKSVPVELRPSNNVRYIVPNYCQIFESCGFRNGLTGTEWLRSLGVEETLQLRASNSKEHLQSPEISAELKYIAQKLPVFLLGVLQANFIQYHKSEEWDRFFRQKNVPILASLEMRSLNSTFLPLPKLMPIASSLGLEEVFGFLREFDGTSAFGVIEWNFLKRFGVDRKIQLTQKLSSEYTHAYKVMLTTSGVRHYKSQVSQPDLKTSLAYPDQLMLIREAFEEETIFVPSSNSMDEWKWDYDEDCVWSGPEWFEYKPPLQAIKEYQTLQALFCNFKKEKYKIILLYDKLNELTEDGKSSEEIEELRRFHFEFRNLLYNPPSRSWCAPSSCIWAPEEVQLPGKFSMATQYKKQRTFVQNVLEIKKPDLEMHILALQKRALENPDKEGILREIKNIRALNPTGNVLREKLSKCKCFPIYRPSQEVKWLDSTGNFAIVDRKEHGDAFKNKINMLDFSLEEVHSINQFLIELGLEGQFTSRAVKVDTKIADGMLNDGPTKDLRRKAYAICRYAAHYGSNNSRSAYDLLQTLEVFTSESITKQVSITQNKKIISVKVHTAWFLHIAQDNNQLKLYVPKEQRQREVCLSRQLPIELLKHLGVPNFRKGAKLGSVIRATSSDAIDSILDSDGIIDVPGIFRPDEFCEASHQVTLLEPHYRDEPSTEHHHVRAQLIDSSLRTLATPGTHPPEIPPERPDLFNELLDAVIKQARSVHGIPAVDNVLIAALSTNARIDTSLAVGSNVAGESLFRIGVAGELFMFEIMKSLGLPLFDLGNWRSTIRHRVIIHNEYKDMPRWSGSETSDIVYEDHDKMLTLLLITNNYFNIEELARLRFARSPTYYIEVKTTPGPLDNAFLDHSITHSIVAKANSTGWKV